jgi:hypothetical protein
VAANPTHIIFEHAINDAMYGNSGITERPNGWWTTIEALVVRLRTVLPNTKLLSHPSGDIGSHLSDLIRFGNQYSCNF